MKTPTPPIALTITGFDPSNGAGITADLQVFAAHGLFGTSAITALTVQNTQGVSATYPVDPDVLSEILENLYVDLPPAGIKIGMLATAPIVEAVANFLRALIEGNKSKRKIPIVLDPVILSSSGAELLNEAGLEVLRRELLPLVTCLTPNRQELGLLTNRDTSQMATVREAMKLQQNSTPSMVILTTGGDQDEAHDLLLLPDGTWHEFISTRIETTSTHGTGCAHSSALLANLIQGRTIVESATYAKSYVENALRTAPRGIGHGRGPMQLSPTIE